MYDKYQPAMQWTKSAMWTLNCLLPIMVYGSGPSSMVGFPCVPVQLQYAASWAWTLLARSVSLFTKHAMTSMISCSSTSRTIAGKHRQCFSLRKAIALHDAQETLKRWACITGCCSYQSVYMQAHQAHAQNVSYMCTIF